MDVSVLMLYKRGEILFAEKDYPAALAICERIVGYGSDDPQLLMRVYNLKARCLKLIGQMEEAIKYHHYELVINKFNNGDVDFMFISYQSIIDCHISCSQLDLALRAADDMLKDAEIKQVKKAELKAKLYIADIIVRKFKQSGEKPEPSRLESIVSFCMKEATENTKEHVDSMFIKAWGHHFEGDVQEAIINIHKCTQLAIRHKFYERAHVALHDHVIEFLDLKIGQLSTRIDRLQQAIRYASQCDDSTATFYYTILLSEQLNSQQRLDEALDVALEKIEQSREADLPNSLKTHFHLVMSKILRRLGRFEEGAYFIMFAGVEASALGEAFLDRTYEEAKRYFASPRAEIIHADGLLDKRSNPAIRVLNKNDTVSPENWQRLCVRYAAVYDKHLEKLRVDNNMDMIDRIMKCSAQIDDQRLELPPRPSLAPSDIDTDHEVTFDSANPKRSSIRLPGFLRSTAKTIRKNVKDTKAILKSASSSNKSSANSSTIHIPKMVDEKEEDEENKVL